MKKLIIALISVLLLTSCSNKPVATVGDIKITKSEFEFYLNSIKNQMSDTELQSDEDWQNKEIEGKKAIDLAKEQAMDNAIKNALYIEAAEAAGLSLSDEEEKDVETTKQQIVSGYGSEKAYKEFLKSSDISDSFIEMMCVSAAYYNKIGDSIINEKSVSDEEFEAYFEENKKDFETVIRKAKHILIATIDPETNQPKSQEEQDAASVLAKDILERVQAGEDFDTLMHQYSEDPGLETSPDGYVFESGDMVAEFEQATDSVGFDEIAFCKSSFGYHIIKRLSLSYEDVSQQIKAEVYGNMIDEQVEKWQKEFSIEIKEDEELLSEIK